MNETILRPVESTNLLEVLRNHLRSHDPEYPEVAKACQEAVQSLRATLKPDISALMGTYIAAQDARITATLLFLFWQGLHQNEACFRDPIQKKFLDLDFEDICQETVLNTLPEAVRAYDCARQFHWALSEANPTVAESITEYYCHLETAGYKLAHYWGFRYGDELLSGVVPGYVPDTALTAAYRRMAREYLEFDPEG